MKLNLGCGSNKLKGYVNIDIEKSHKPDLIFNFLEPPLPFRRGSVSEIVFFHTIEHVRKVYHARLLQECHRLLKKGGLLLLSYPEFLKCVENWEINKSGIKDKWEQTIFGRQLYPSDYHVALMHTPDVEMMLKTVGFVDIKSKAEPEEAHNTIISARRGENGSVDYENLVKADMERITFKKGKNEHNHR